MPQSEFSSYGASCRPKVFLGDLEYAKKEEWERRKKLRLKQVRQQARDIASVIRNQTSNAKKKTHELNKCVDHVSAAKSMETRKVELEQKLTECMTSIGTAHSTAAMMTEVEQLLQHKIELQNTLARVRAELAVEKAKETGKPRHVLFECPREGISVSKMKSVKLAAQKPIVRKISPSEVKPRTTDSCRTTVPATPPNMINVSGRVESEDHSRDLDDSLVQLPTEKTIFSPPLMDRKRHKKPGSRVSGRKSCPPITESIEALDSSPDSDDSGQTWPPSVSVKKKKSTKVRMYDHSAKKCSEYVQLCGVIRMEKPSPSNMKDLIDEEEKLVSKKTEVELENRKVELQRGLRALRQEVAKQDFDAAIKDLCLGSKERRFQKAHSYQPFAESDINRDNVQIGSRDRTQKASNHDGPHVVTKGQSSNNRPPVPAVVDNIQSIVTRLAEQREAILQDPSARTGVSTGGVDDSEDECARLPLWIHAESTAESIVPDRVPTPETAMCNMNDAKKGSPVRESNDVSSDLSSFIRHEQEFEQSESTNPPKQLNDKSSSSSVSQDDQSSSNSSNRNESSSPAGIHVQVQITRESPVKRLSFQTPKKETESSTSYYSPPEKLSPQQISVLSDILSKMSIKNRNPVLHHYITRVLEMSRQSLSDLEVSGCSEFSIQSELFSNNNVPSSKSHNGVADKQNRKTAKNRVCLKELDNASTAGTVCSSPRTDSVDEVPPPDHSGKIAQLLRNIIELQRVYDEHTSSDPSLVVSSDSHTSYRSVPSGIDAKHYRGVAPVEGNVLNYCEDTGIFVSRQDASRGAEQVTLASLLNGHYFKLPAELLPNPFAETRREVHLGLNRQSACPEYLSGDVPDGKSWKPDMDPRSVYIPQRGANKVFNTLSDIESVVSSIQSTPTKKVARPTSPAGSLPPDDDSSASRFSSREFISSQELQNNDLINTTSSSSDFEDVFRSLGLGWALSTLRRTRTSQNLRAEDSSSKSGSLLSSEKTRSGYHHSTPMKGSNPEATEVSPEPDFMPSLTPPNIALLCPNWQK